MGKSDLDLDSDDKVKNEVKYSEMPIKASNYIDELCFEFKIALKRISSLKKKNSSLR